MVMKVRRFNVYVIGLSKDVLEDRRFREANPQYKAGKPCVYVGRSVRTPEERLAQHKAGYKSSRYPRRYGRYLQRRHFEKLNPMTYEEASRQEVELARRLRARGYAVWQN